jgi:hypothetical protein
VNNKMMIHCEEGIKIHYFALFDESGKLIKSFAINNHLTDYEIDMTKIQAGKYILIIRTADKLLSKEVIKK